MYNDELKHYGVKGMKWGVRKSEYKSMNKAQRKRVRDDYKAKDAVTYRESKVKQKGKAGLIRAGALAATSALTSIASAPLIMVNPFVGIGVAAVADLANVGFMGNLIYTPASMATNAITTSSHNRKVKRRLNG